MLKEPLISTRPERVHVELTTRCNLRCIYCSHSYADRRELADILPTALRTLEQELLPKAQEVELQGTGESLLFPEFDRILRASRAHGCRVTLITNGTLLDGKRLQELADAGCHLVVSLDGARASTYEWHRPGARFEDVLENLRYWKTACSRVSLASAPPSLSVHMTLTAVNICELFEMVGLVAMLGADSLFVSIVRRAIPDDALWRKLSLELKESEVAVSLKAALQEAKRHRIAFASSSSTVRHEKGTVGRRSCVAPWRHIYLTARGEVFPCCQFQRGMGNCVEAPFDEVWRGQRFDDLRSKIAAHQYPAECQTCVLPWGVSSPVISVENK